MLNLLTGPDRIQLSEQILEKICEEAHKGTEGLILIVPEQFSHETERQLCISGGDTISRYAEVLGFSRLVDRVAVHSGGIAQTYLDNGGRLLSMALAAEQVSSRIKLYGAVLRRPEFLSNMISVIEEFQSYCLPPEQLKRSAVNAEGHFAQKLEELALLYEAYLAVCDQGKMDPGGKLLWLEHQLEASDWCENKTIYLDGFRDFTNAEFEVVKQLISHCRNVTVSLCINPASPDHFPAELYKRLIDFAKQEDLTFAAEPCRRSSFRNPSLDRLLDHLFLSDKAVFPSGEELILKKYQSPEEECRAAVLQAKQLMMSGARCRDIAIASTDPALYEAPLRASIHTAGLSAYFAGRDEVLDKPVFHAILSSLQSAVGPMEYEDVSQFLKSGLPVLDRDLCDRLDRYAYRWNLHGGQWESEWEFHPRGFGEVWLPEDYQILERLNTEKNKALAPLIQLRHGLFSAGTTGEMVLACHRFSEELDLRKRLEAQANILGGQLGQELLQIHDIFCDSLEQTWLVLGDSVRTPDDFVKLYRSVLSQYHISTIPAGVDQIYVGSLQDLRSKKVPHLLVLGAVDGSFPGYKTGEGLLTEEERRILLSQGISLAPSRVDQMDREMGQIHAALSAATQSIWISCSGDQPAWLFLRAAALFPDALSADPYEKFLDVPSYAAWRIRHNDPTPASGSLVEQWEESLRSLRDYQFTPLKEDTVNGLYGKRIYLSASRIDKYAACRLAFFLSYGLKAEPQRQAKLDASVFGTFVHEVLEKTVIRVNAEGGFRRISEELLLSIAAEEINHYADAHFPKQAERDAYLFHRSQAEIMDIVRDLGDELRNSLFDPVSCELEFSASGALPSIEVDGKLASCKISGFVDRVDLYDHNGNTYIRVVDYKTGYKDFDYTDILNGAGLQMLIYLFALKTYGCAYYGKEKLVPAGVLYLPARKNYSPTEPLPTDEYVNELHQDERRRRGLISNRPEVLAAMETDPEHPRFMPYQMGKNGLKGNLADDGQMQMLERYVLRTLAAMTDSIASGDVYPNPIVRGQDSSCRFCDYKTVCHMDLCHRDIRPMAATSAEKFWEKLEQEERGHG